MLELQTAKKEKEIRLKKAFVNTTPAGEKKGTLFTSNSISQLGIDTDLVLRLAQRSPFMLSFDWPPLACRPPQTDHVLRFLYHLLPHI